MDINEKKIAINFFFAIARSDNGTLQHRQQQQKNICHRHCGRGSNVGLQSMSPRIYFFRSSACSTRTPRHRRGLHIGVTHARTRTHARAHTQFAGADSAALRHRDAGVHARAHQVAVWMSSVHACIERLIRHYAIRKASPCSLILRPPTSPSVRVFSLWIHPIPPAFLPSLPRNRGFGPQEAASAPVPAVTLALVHYPHLSRKFIPAR